MSNRVDIHKAGGILIRDRKFLVNKKKGKEFFVAPGGKLEEGESPEEALIRELREEHRIEVNPSDLEKFGTFYAQAAEQESERLKMDVFLVHRWQGEIEMDSEIEEMLWINSKIPEGVCLGSIFEHDVLPRLKEKNLID